MNLIILIIIVLLALICIVLLTITFIKSLKQYKLFKTAKDEIVIGMSLEEVISSLGKPRSMKINGKNRAYLFKAPEMISCFKEEINSVWIEFKDNKVV